MIGTVGSCPKAGVCRIGGFITNRQLGMNGNRGNGVGLSGDVECAGGIWGRMFRAMRPDDWYGQIAMIGMRRSP